VLGFQGGGGSAIKEKLKSIWTFYITVNFEQDTMDQMLNYSGQKMEKRLIF